MDENYGKVKREVKYRLKDDYRKTTKGVEHIILKGTVVEAIQEQIHYGRGTHKVQVKAGDVIVWLPKWKLSVTR